MAALMVTSGAYRVEDALAMPLDVALWLLAGRRALVRTWQREAGDDGRPEPAGGRDEQELPGGRKVVRFRGAQGMEELRRLARQQGPTKLGV